MITMQWRNRFAAGLAGVLSFGALAGADDALPVSTVSTADGAVRCTGVFTQGGLAVCRTPPGATLALPGRVWPAGADGVAPVGFERDAPEQLTLRVDGTALTLAIAPRTFAEQRIDGLPPAKVRAQTEAQKAHAARSWRTKRAAFGTIVDGDDFLAGFARPSEGRTTGVYGSRRILNGEDGERIRTHWGVDYAASTGTPVTAPAGGMITLADPDLYYEGGTIFLDHGDGLVSVFMHLSAVDVTAGDRVDAGERIGAIGSTGRSTGPHLHWGVKWRDAFYVDPDAALRLPAAAP